MLSSLQFAGRVLDALNRLEPSHMRRAGTSKGAGAFDDIVQWDTLKEQTPANRIYLPDITYIAAGDDEGAFLINTTGLYSVSATAAGLTAGTVSINVGPTLTNDLLTPNTRTMAEAASSTQNIGPSWTGLINAGEKVWVTHDSTPSASADETQITVVRLR